MLNLTVETPGHQFLDYKEDDDSGDVILHRHYRSSISIPFNFCLVRRTDVVPILHIEKAPKSAQCQYKLLFLSKSGIRTSR